MNASCHTYECVMAHTHSHRTWHIHPSITHASMYHACIYLSITTWPIHTCHNSSIRATTQSYMPWLIHLRVERHMEPHTHCNTLSATHSLQHTHCNTLTATHTATQMNESYVQCPIHLRVKRYMETLKRLNPTWRPLNVSTPPSRAPHSLQHTLCNTLRDP